MASELLEGYFVGTVLKIDKESRRLGIYIPKLMPTMSEGSVTSYTLPMNSGLSVGEFSTNVSDTVTKINYIMAKPEDWCDPLPDIGSKAMVYFIDDSPSQAIWKPFNPNGDNETIAEERYPNSFTLTIGGKAIDVDKNDSISITLPEYLTIASYSDEDDPKSKTIDVIADKAFMNRTKMLQEEVESLRKTIDCMIDESRRDAIDAISAIDPAEIMTNPYLDRFKACRSILTKRAEDAADLTEIASARRLGRAVLPELNALYSNYRSIYAAYSKLNDDTLSLMPDFSIGNLKSALDGAFIDSMTCSDTLPRELGQLKANGLATSFDVTYSYIDGTGEDASTTVSKSIFEAIDLKSDPDNVEPAFPSSALADILNISNEDGSTGLCCAFAHRWSPGDGTRVVYSSKSLAARYFGFYMAAGYAVKAVDEGFGCEYHFTLDSGADNPMTLDELNSAISNLSDSKAHTISMVADGVDTLSSTFRKS